MNDTSKTHTHTNRHQLPEQSFLLHTHILPHTLCIHATVLGSLWSELLSDTKKKSLEWCVSSVNALNEIFTATEK